MIPHSAQKDLNTDLIKKERSEGMDWHGRSPPNNMSLEMASCSYQLTSKVLYDIENLSSYYIKKQILLLEGVS
jgi:hypothetical protein